MRISDWSSDVCSSDLRGPPGRTDQKQAMPEDDSSTPPERPERRSWLDRIGAMLSGEPTTREDLVELLRDTQADGLIAADTLRMMEGAIAVSDLSVRSETGRGGKGGFSTGRSVGSAERSE